jgi:hypothetical protein
MICRHCENQPIDCSCASAIRAHRNWLARETVIRERDVRVPVPVITGQLEKLSDDELAELIVDLKHEHVRRSGASFEELCVREPDRDKVMFHD